MNSTESVPHFIESYETLCPELQMPAMMAEQLPTAEQAEKKRPIHYSNRHSWTDKHKEVVQTMLALGKTQRQIAHLLKRTKGAVGVFICRHPEVLPAQKADAARKWSLQEKEKAVYLHECEGKTYKEIATAIDRTLSAVKHFFVNYRNKAYPFRERVVG